MVFDLNFIHPEPSPLAGRTIIIKLEVPGVGGRPCTIRDWWDRISGKSWTEQPHLPAVRQYRDRAVARNVLDDDVLLGIVGTVPFLIHASEIQRVMPDNWKPQPSISLETKAETHFDAEVTAGPEAAPGPEDVTAPLIFPEPDPRILEELKEMKAHFDKLYKMLGL